MKSMPMSASAVLTANLTLVVQAYGSKRIDASLLLIRLVRLPVTDRRVQGTLQTIEDMLLIDGEFVLRYKTENPGDGFPPGEGIFWRAVSGWSATTCCRAAMRKPGSYSIV
jgi:GH15 family glucan-1,4-alpha-glucosidase